MVNGLVLEGPIAEIREREVRLLYDAAEAIGGQAGGEEDRKRLLDISSDLREMFLMVVIIGEFNAGKSTFVNALLGEPLLPMGITPTTDAIELIRFGTARSQKPQSREDSVREWTHPKTGGPGVVIVDTPGTGSVFAKHEQIAKAFLHRSDLVIFVLSAKRAFAETERLYLDLARGYGKKVIVVVNQADLLEGREYQEVKDFVTRQIDELLSLRPPIFMVSAKKSLAGEKAGGLLGSTVARGDWGMDAVRDHLRKTFEQVPPARQKLTAQLDMLRTVTGKYRGAIQARLNLVSSDTMQAEDLQREMETQAAAISKQFDSTMSELHNVFEELRKRGYQFIDTNLKVFGALRGLDKEKLRAEFDRQVVAGSLVKMKSAAEQYVNAVVDGSRNYWHSVIDRLNRMDAILREESGTLDAATYADQRAALQAALSIADAQLQTVSNDSMLANLEGTFGQNVRGFMISVSGILSGAVAFLVSAATGISAAHGLTILFGVVFAPVALIGGGIGAAWFLSKATRDARNQLDASLKTLEDGYRTALNELTSRERNRLLQYGKQILSPVFSQLQVLAARYRDQQNTLDGFVQRARDLEAEIATVALPAVQSERTR